MERLAGLGVAVRCVGASLILSLWVHMPAALAQSTVAGRVDDRFSVTPGGTASYRVPIPVPPAASGHQPKLEVAYLGRSTDALGGMGWALSGLSSISRCPKTPGQDGVRDSVKFDDNDRYCLDGQRLMLVSGTYGQPGAEYRSELDDFNKVVSYGRSGNGPTYFKVWTKGGRVLEFGNTSDSRIEVVAAPGVTAPWSAGTVREWAVNKDTDPSGNVITMEYDEDGVNGVYRPYRLLYGSNPGVGTGTQNVITFQYQTTAYPLAKYRAGSISKNMSRLYQIVSYAESLAVSKTNFTYSFAGPAQSERLQSLQVCDGSNNCLPSISLAYIPANNSFASSTVPWPFPSGMPGQSSTLVGYDTSTGSRTESTYATLIDLNGDGLKDAYWVAFGQWPPTPATANLNTATGLSSTAVTWPLPSGVTSMREVYGTETRIQLIDLNGDGLPDLYRTKGSAATGSDRSEVFFNTGTGFSGTATPWGLPSAIVTPNQEGGMGATVSALVDMDGDGLPDIYHTPASGAQVVYRNTGSGFSSTPIAWPIPPGITGPTVLFPTQQLVLKYLWDPLESTCRHASLSIL